MLAEAGHNVGDLYTYNGTFADRDVQDSTKKSGYTTVPAVQVNPAKIYLSSAADRAGRIGPPISMVVQESGGIHEIAINVDLVS